MKFGQKLKKMRLDANLTQKELAEKMNVSFQTISKWESEINEPDMQSIRDLAKIFNVSIEYLFSENEEVIKNKENENTYKNLKIIKKVGRCRNCNKEIFDNEKYINREVAGTKCLYCSDCDKKIFKEEYDNKKEDNLNKTKIGICNICKKDIFDDEIYNFITIDNESKIVCKNCYNGYYKPLECNSSSKSNRESNKQIIKKDTHEIKLQTGVCNCCNKPIYAGDKTFNVIKGHRGNKVGLTYCEKCYKNKLLEEKRQKEMEEEKERREIRIIAFILSFIYVIFAFYLSITQHQTIGLGLAIFIPIISIYAMISFIYCVGYEGTVQDVFGFFITKTIRFPGIIFSFSFDGLKFLIGMKILFFIISILFFLLMSFLSVSIGSVFSMFVFPFKLSKNIKYN